MNPTIKRYLKKIPGVAPIAERRFRKRLRLKFEEEFALFRKLAAASDAPDRFAIREEDMLPCLDDRTADTPFEAHYTYHPAWAARILARTRPAEHVDIGSILPFACIASAFVPIRFYDYRPAAIHLTGLTTGQADLLRLPFADRSIPSLSCMHVLEHVGLGRYGDPLDPDGDRKAMRELRRVLAPAGQLLVVVPVGKPKVCFNAHRIYSHSQIVSAFHPLRLVSFALIPDNGRQAGLIEDATPEQVEAQSYGCGCFWFRRENDDRDTDD